MIKYLKINYKVLFVYKTKNVWSAQLVLIR